MNIIVCPLSRAPHMARIRRPSHVVSLLDPGTPFPTLDNEIRQLRLPVHDIELEMVGLHAVCEQRMRMLLDFVDTWQCADPILIHCYAGISRSTATAYITACAHNPDCDEEAIALALRAASPTASPNRRFVSLADAELGRGGRMRRAIDKIGRGAGWLDVSEAASFELPVRFA